MTTKIKKPSVALTKALQKPPSTVATKSLVKPVTKNSATQQATKTTKSPSPAGKVVPASKKITVKTELIKPVAVPVVTALIEKPIKAKKIKLVRDSFTIPKPEYLILDNLKLRAADLKHPVKKGELIRAGIKALAAMTDANLLTALKAVPILKSGRPSK
jgi:Cu/Ag efflux protein CusF